MSTPEFPPDDPFAPSADQEEPFFDFQEIIPEPSMDDPFAATDQEESDPFAPPETIFASSDISELPVLSEDPDLPPEPSFISPPLEEEPFLPSFEEPSELVEQVTHPLPQNDFLSELENLSVQFENTTNEKIVLPDIDEHLLIKKKSSSLPEFESFQNEKNSHFEKNIPVSQNEKSTTPQSVPSLPDKSDLLPDITLVPVTSLSQNENSKPVPLQRHFFEGFQQTPVTSPSTLTSAPVVLSLGTPLAKEWAYDTARGPVFSFVTKNNPDFLNERGVVESVPALLLRLGFLRFQYHVFSLQAYQTGHIGIGQVLEQFNSMLEAAMRKFAGLTVVETYGLQKLHMEVPGPGVFLSEEVGENLHWLLCEEEQFHLVFLPDLSIKMVSAGQSQIYEALLQFASSTALRFAWLTTTYDKLIQEKLYDAPEKKGWVCLSCGHVLFEKEPFDCPFCAALPCSFVPLEQFGYFIETAKLVEK